MDNYAQKRLQARLRLIRFLVSSADTRSLTHVEIHHLLEVALIQIHKAQDETGDKGISNFSHHNDPDPVIAAADLSDIPF